MESNIFPKIYCQFECDQGIIPQLVPVTRIRTREFFYIIGLIYISDYLCLFKKKFRTIVLYFHFK